MAWKFVGQQNSNAGGNNKQSKARYSLHVGYNCSNTILPTEQSIWKYLSLNCPL